MADTKISALDTKTIPIAADITNILDSAASNVDKKITLGTLQAIVTTLTTAPGEHITSGLTISMTAGTALNRGNVCYIGSDGKLELCDADAAITMPAFCMVTDATISEDAVGNVLLYGVYQDASWSWATVGSLLYPGTSPGTIVDTAPAGTGDQVQPIGWVLAATKIFFFPYPLLIEVGTGIATPAEGGTGVANNNASTLTISGNYATSLTVSDTTEIILPTTGTIATRTGIETLTNKRVNPRVKTLPYNDATITVGETADYDTDLADQFIIVTGLSQDTNFGAPGGTPVDGQKLTFRILSDSSARGLTWNSVFVSRGVALPSTTVASKYLYVGFIYNSAASKWDCVASAQEA